MAVLRSAAGRNPYDRACRTSSASCPLPLTGVKHFHHPVVGDISLNYQRLELAADSGLVLYTYTADPGSKSDEALRLLGSWAATTDQTGAAHTAGR